MAAGGFREFVAGETLDEDKINDYLMQGMLVFGGTAARGSAITSPVEGQFSFLTDSDTIEYYDGSAWVEFSTTPGGAVVSGTTGSPNVTSGTVIGGTAYDIYIFKGDGSITFSDPGFADLLVVGGGGAGGQMISFVGVNAGGGGGGGVVGGQYYVPAETITVTIGAGGAARSNGLGSRFGAIALSAGGGVGAFAADITSGFAGGQDGGSGGGGGAGSSAFFIGAGLGQIGQGSDGGTGQQASGSTNGAGGGGGAGTAGSNGSGSVGGNGGAGAIRTIIPAALATSQSVGQVSGSDVYYAGGGGGARDDGSAGTGGLGGGGDGAFSTTRAINGGANTGGGGGGEWANNTAPLGGSGLVIVRVAV